MVAECHQSGEPQASSSDDRRSGRWREVEDLDAFWEARSDSPRLSVRGFARSREVPESTFRDQVHRAEAAEAAAEVIEFIESMPGLAFMRQIVLAARYVIMERSGGGYRMMSEFLELSGLSEFVGASHGAQYQAMCEMEEAIVAYGRAERARSAVAMRPRRITLVDDETFHHGKICLVAIEPVSNFIVLEQYAEDRTAETWTAALSEELEGLPVTVFQCGSDEARALLKVARTGFGAHHSPDTFHVQQDVGRGTTLALRRQAALATAEVARLRLAHEESVIEAEAYRLTRCGPGRPKDYGKRLADQEAALGVAQEAAAESEHRCETVRVARRKLSTLYHPFDLGTGAPRSGEVIEADLRKQFEVIDEASTAAGLSAKCRAWVDKARRVAGSMVATVAFVHTLIRSQIEALLLAPVVEAAVMEQLIGAHYLGEAARKASSAAERDRILEVVDRLRSTLDGPDSALAGLGEHERAALETVALECAQFFQRSSSCVEGRNGLLSLRHHSHHYLSPRKLEASTVVHNFGVRRADGTTAAERFFGLRHANLFEHLLASLPLPRRPAARRHTLH